MRHAKEGLLSTGFIISYEEARPAKGDALGTGVSISYEGARHTKRDALSTGLSISHEKDRHTNRDYAMLVTCALSGFTRVWGATGNITSGGSLKMFF